MQVHYFDSTTHRVDFFECDTVSVRYHIRVSPRKCVSQGGAGGGGALAIVDGGCLLYIELVPRLLWVCLIPPTSVSALLMCTDHLLP